MKHSPYVVLFALLFVGLYDAQFQYEITQLQGSDCVIVAQNECVQCGNYYYSAYVDGDNGYYAKYTDNNCNFFYSGYYIMYHGDCIKYEDNCSMFLLPTAYSYYSASVSTTSDSLKVGAWPRDSEFLEMTISSTSAQVTGFLELVQFKTPSTKFLFESLLSSSKYSSNLGIFDFGTTYTKGDLTFTVNRLANQTTPFLPATPDYAVVFTPFTNVHVSSSAEYNVAFLDDGNILVETDSSYNLDGLVIGLFNYSNIHSMSLFPPAYQNSDAKLVFEMSSNEGYWTYPCDADSQIIYCEFSSTPIIIIGASGSIPPFGSFGSFMSFSLSLDEQRNENVKEADQMAFSLF